MTDLERLDGNEWTQQRCNDYADGYEFARRELLANGQRVEPDYEAAWKAFMKFTAMSGYDWPMVVRKIVDAAVGGRLLVDPPKEEER